MKAITNIDVTSFQEEVTDIVESTPDGRVLERLATHAKEIRAVDVKSHSIPYSQKDWLLWFGGDYFERDEAVVQALKRFPDAIARGDLFELGEHVATNGYRLPGLRALWALTYAWGGGAGAMGYRARVNARLALFDQRFGDLVPRTIAMLSSNDIAAAYQTLDPLIGAGEAFLTKFLYFVSKPNLCEPLPLIYDEQVKGALRALVGATRWALPLGATMADSHHRIYAFYVETLHRWAEAIGSTPEQLELFLFRRRGSLL